MATTWAFRKTAITAASTAIEQLRDEYDRLEAEWDERSETWQDSDRGNAVRSWLDTIESLISGAADEFDELADNLRPDLT